MTKTNDTSKFAHAKLDNRVRADNELDAVSGTGIYMRPNAEDLTTTASKDWIELYSFQPK